MGATTISMVVLGAAGFEFVALGGIVFTARRLRRREDQLEQLWDRHRRAVDRDVAYLHEWQDFLGAFAGDITEDERG
jgi:hypothetical protein